MKPTSLLFALLMGMASGLLSAQLPDARVSVGTTRTGTDGVDRAYLHWRAPDALSEVHIYQKDGTADSPNAFTRVAVVRRGGSLLAVNAAITEGQALGETPGPLETALDTLFSGIPLAPGLSVAEKLAALVNRSSSDPVLLNSLRFMGRVFPSISMSLGEAITLPLPAGVTRTYELRDAAGDAAGVFARLTLTGGAAPVLPAPTQPLETPDFTPKGHLQARLIWGHPPELGRLSMLTAGFNIYRADPAFAMAEGWDLTPPAASVLAQLSADHPDVVARTNGGRVFVDRFYNQDEIDLLRAQASVTPDASTWPGFNGPFHIDTKGAPIQGPGFMAGDQYYYFVVAVDLMGREGEVSEGLLVTLCDRYPPAGPTRAQVMDDINFLPDGTLNPSLKVIFDPVEDPDHPVIGYEVYRWTSQQQFLQNADDPAAYRVKGRIAQPDPFSVDPLVWVDDDPLDPGRPSAPDDYGKTFWYTIRAVSNSGCGPENFSPHSAPVFGVLRNYAGPGDPLGTVITRCDTLDLALDWEDTDLWVENKNLGILFEFTVNATGRVRELDFAEFWLGTDVQPTVLLGRVGFVPSPFDPSARQATYSDRHPRANTAANPKIWCRVRTRSGIWQQIHTDIPLAIRLPEEAPQPHWRHSLTYTVDVGITDCDEGIVPNPSHQPDKPGGGRGGPTIGVTTPPGTAEIKIFRRLDDGPLGMVKQMPHDFNPSLPDVEIEDEFVPANGGRLCYYAQLFDQDGNGSNFVFIKCVDILPPGGVPTPVLNPTRYAGPRAAPVAKLEWTCPPANVERFVVYVHREDESAPPAPVANLRPAPELDLARMRGNSAGEGGAADPAILPYQAYHTQRVSAAFGLETGVFPMNLPVEEGVWYRYFVVAVSYSGARSAPSEEQRFRWSEISGHEDAPQGDLPWPARAGAPLVVPRISAMAAEFVQIPGVYTGAGIRVGEIPASSFTQNDNDAYFKSAELGEDDVGTTKPESYLYALGPKGESPLWLLYRRQIPGGAYPDVAGDLIQVSPLIDRLRVVQADNLPNSGDYNWKLVDPFFVIDPNAQAGVHPIYLKDTQPTPLSSRYHYYLVQLDSISREMRAIIDLGTLTTPDNHP